MELETLLRLAVTTLILYGAFRSLRQDPRFDRREIVIQSAWIVAVVVATIGVVWMAIELTAGLGGRQPTVVVLIVIGWVLVAVLGLARYLQRRLARRSAAIEASRLSPPPTDRQV